MRLFPPIVETNRPPEDCAGRRHLDIPLLTLLLVLPRVGFAPSLKAQEDLEPVLVKDINVTPREVGMNPGNFTALGSQLFFTSDDGLWVTDGTVAGTTHLESGDPRFFRHRRPISLGVAAGTLYYSARDETGRELWRSDGTVEGTFRLVDLDPRTNPLESGGGGSFTEFGGLVYFVASDIRGPSLWRTDGTEAGTEFVVDPLPDDDVFGPGALHRLGDLLIFTLRTERTPIREELWRSDGTAEGTMRLHDIFPGGNAIPRIVTVLGDFLYFTATDAAGRSLWRTDGSDAGTVRLDIGANEFEVLGDDLYYRADDDGVPGFELWRLDTITLATEPASPINFLGTFGILQLTAVGSVLYFNGNDGTTGEEVWRHDPATGETLPATDINPSSVTQRTFQRLIDVDGTLFMNRIGTGLLWTTDGTPASTRQIELGGETLLGAFILASFDGALFLNADFLGQEFWRTDGTPEGSTEFRLRADTTLPDRVNLAPSVSVATESALYFVASDGLGEGADENRQLWKTDGTQCGTVRVSGDHPDFDPRALTELGGMIYFVADDGTTGYELWRHDPALNVTERLTDLNPEGDAFSDFVLIATDDALYFPARTENGFLGAPPGVGVPTLWRYDIATGDLEEVSEVPIGDGLLLDDRILFFSSGGLWMHDTTSSVTEQIGGVFGSLMTVAGGNAFFLERTGDFSHRLWRTDGTAAGTRPLDMGEFDFMGGLFAVDGWLYFNGVDGVTDNEQWRYDIAADTIEPAADSVPEGFSSPRPMAHLGDRVIFFTFGSQRGSALYSHDPETRVVELLFDPQPVDNNNGVALSLFENHRVVGETLYFIADPWRNAELSGLTRLYRSDGTPEGTMELDSEFTGFRDLASWNDVVFVTIPGFGGELYRLGGSAACDGDEEAPSVSGVVATPNPVEVGQETVLTATGSDAASGGSDIVSASYTIEGGVPMAMAASDGAFDSSVEDVVAALVFEVAGAYDVCVSVTDAAGNTSESACTTIIVLAPDTEAPIVSELEADPNPAEVEEPVEVTATIDDTAAGESNIVEALLIVDGGDPIPMEASDGVFDGPLETVRTTLTFAGPGEYELCVIATDAAGNTSEPTCVLLTVLALNEPPDCSAAALSVASCWLPNHKFVLTEITGVVDPDGDPVAIEVLSITQDEAVLSSGRGSGQTCPDAVLVDTDGNGSADAAGVRCERDGTGNGRVYTIRFMALDDHENTCEGTLTFCVPHDGSPGTECIDDGGTFDSFACAAARNVEPADSHVVTLEEFERLTPEPLFLRGDVNWDDQIDIGDGFKILHVLFESSTTGPPDCLDAADANDDGAIDLSDVVNVLSYLFLGGRTPSPPIVVIGEDPTADGLDCD